MSSRIPRWAAAAALLTVVLALTPPTHADTCSPGGGFCIPSSAAVYANPHWSIQLTSFGYSDFVIFHLPPFPRWNPGHPTELPPIHEMFSGEWAFAVRYNGLFFWLEPCHVYPDWLTNSNFIVETPINFPGDSDGDGMLEGFSVISNGDLRIRIDYDFEKATDGVNQGTAMGRGALGTTMEPFRLSDPYVLIQRFTVENISGVQLDNVSLYGMIATHPGNTEYPGIDGAYDTTMYSVGGFQDFFWDVTTAAVNSGITDGFRTDSLFDDAVSYSIDMAPGAVDIDIYPGHEFGDDGLTTDPQDAIKHGLKPLCGTHCNMENGAMNNQTVLQGVEIAAGFRMDAGSLADGMIWDADVLLSVASRATGAPAQTCAHIEETGGDPRILLGKGACAGGTSTTFTYDFAMGSMSELSRVPACGSGPKGVFDCTALINLVCKAKQHGMSQLALDDDAHKTDLLFYLARISQPFTSWGMGNNGPLSTADLLRFYFTPQTASGIDVCDRAPATTEAVRDMEDPISPGMGRREEVGLGIRPPERAKFVMP